MDTTPAVLRTVEGVAELRRVGRLRFPTEELVTRDERIAALGRDGSLRIFFGPGRRVQLADGVEWRIRALASGKFITPYITSDAGKIVTSGPLYGRRSYGINGKDYGYSLFPAGHSGLLSSPPWILNQHEQEVASIDARGRSIATSQPVPVAAVIMAFTLLKHGIPGESRLAPDALGS